MNTPSVAEIALPASQQAVEAVLHRRIQEVIAKVSREFMYEIICAETLQRVMHRMCNEIGRVTAEFDLPRPIEAFYEDADNGGKVLLFSYERRVIGRAYLTP